MAHRDLEKEQLKKKTRKFYKVSFFNLAGNLTPTGKPFKYVFKWEHGINPIDCNEVNYVWTA